MVIINVRRYCATGNNLWFITGDLPSDIPNALVYLAEDRMYLMDTSAGSTMRASIIKVLDEASPMQSFTLLNSHGHPDHIGNNDVIHNVQAEEKDHYLSEPGMAMFDAASYFADQFQRLSKLFDPVTGFQANRLRWRFAGLFRDFMTFFVGERQALKIFFSIYIRKFQPLRQSPETVQFYESLPRRTFTIGGVEWTGWAMGNNDVLVLEDRGHTPDEVFFYIPEHKLLHTGDLTFPLFPTFPDSDGKVIREMLQRCYIMASAGVINLLTDGHNQQFYHGQEEVVTFLKTLLHEHEHFQTLLKNILEEHDGLTVGEVYEFVLQHHDDPVVLHYLSLEYPHLPMALQQIIGVSISQRGYVAKGPMRNKRFYRPDNSTSHPNKLLNQ